jgi:F-type H+-transporting ATPase subunit epsilon
MFKLSLLTPEKKVIVDQEITEITVPISSGEVNILPGHLPMIATLGTGILKFKAKGEDIPQRCVISWGYCEISPEGVNILAEFIQAKSEINVDQAKAAIATAEQKLAKETLSDDEFERTAAESKKARAGIQLLQ